jgi:hypothetical protein
LSLRLLLLDYEAPPGAFDGGDSGVFRWTVRALSEECGFPTEPAEFLRRFAESGSRYDCFVRTPGEEPDVPRIAALIGEVEPRVVVGVMIRLERLVREAVAMSPRPDTPWECLHFPSHRSHTARMRFHDGLRGVIREFAPTA